MARPASAPRLAALVPEDVAGAVCQLVLEHLQHQALALGAPGVDIGIAVSRAVETVIRTSDLALTVQDLTRYAQRGELGDWPEPSCAVDAIQSVCSALYSCAGQPGTFELGELASLESEDDPSPIGLVLLGAHGRVQLSRRGARLSTRELAVLAGLSPQAVRALVRSGELPATKEGIARPDARRWLATRGVRGFEVA